MNFEMNSTTIKKMLEEPNHTVLEYALMRYAMQLRKNLIQQHNEKENIKQGIFAAVRRMVDNIEGCTREEIVERIIFPDGRNNQPAAETQEPEKE